MEKKKENKKVVMNTKPNTNHAALATQPGNTTRETGREENLHIRHRLIGTDKQTRMDWGETEAIIGKAPRLGIHTREMQTPPRMSAKL